MLNEKNSSGVTRQEYASLVIGQDKLLRKLNRKISEGTATESERTLLQVIESMAIGKPEAVIEKYIANPYTKDPTEIFLNMLKGSEQDFRFHLKHYLMAAAERE